MKWRYYCVQWQCLEMQVGFWLQCRGSILCLRGLAKALSNWARSNYPKPRTGPFPGSEYYNVSIRTSTTRNGHPRRCDGAFGPQASRVQLETTSHGRRLGWALQISIPKSSPVWRLATLKHLNQATARPRQACLNPARTAIKYRPISAA